MVHAPRRSRCAGPALSRGWRSARPRLLTGRPTTSVPTCWCSRSASGRTRTSYAPLFAGYVFLLGDDDQRQQALTTNCISKCLAVPDPQTLVRDLSRIKQLIDSEVPLTPEAKRTTGARVRVVSGVLAGVEGVVMQRRGREHLLVALQFLQQGASVLLEDIAVEPVS